MADMMELFDFTTLDEPTFPIRINIKNAETGTEEQVNLHVQIPDEALINRLLSAAKELKANAKNAKAITKTMELVADILSWNEEGIKFTGDDLTARCGIKFVGAVKFIGQYLEFVNKVIEAKN